MSMKREVDFLQERLYDMEMAIHILVLRRDSLKSKISRLLEVIS